MWGREDIDSIKEHVKETRRKRQTEREIHGEREAGRGRQTVAERYTERERERESKRERGGGCRWERGGGGGGGVQVCRENSPCPSHFQNHFYVNKSGCIKCFIVCTSVVQMYEEGFTV